MLSSAVELVGHFVIAVISHLGYPGIVLLMGIESACIPLPSEVIMPFSGYLVHLGRFKLGWVAITGALGCNAGSLVAYYVGSLGGRPLAERYGRYVLVSRHDLELADIPFPRCLPSKLKEILVRARMDTSAKEQVGWFSTCRHWLSGVSV